MSEAFPAELQALIGSESILFSLQSKRLKPKREIIGNLVFGIVWTGFTTFMIIVFVGFVFQKQQMSWQPLVIPGLVYGFFLAIGIGFLVKALASFRPGPWLVGTATRLLSFRNGNIGSTNWSEITGMDSYGAPNDLDISVYIRQQERGQAQGMIHLCGIENGIEVEKMIREKINRIS